MKNIEVYLKIQEILMIRSHKTVERDRDRELILMTELANEQIIVESIIKDLFSMGFLTLDDMLGKINLFIREETLKELLDD